MSLLGLAYELDPRIRPNNYWTIGRGQEALPLRVALA